MFILTFVIFFSVLFDSTALGEVGPEDPIALTHEECLTGFVLTKREFKGPGEWRESFDPVWVYAFHTLRLRYRGKDIPADTVPVLTLRPGSIGPVTPGATNLENPFATGVPVVVIRAKDLTADGTVQTLKVELEGKMQTPQIDQLKFTLPAGAELFVEELRFVADPEILPCDSYSAAMLPASAERLQFHGPQKCGEAVVTSVRGRDTIRVFGGNRRGRTIYLSMRAHLLGVSDFFYGRPPHIGIKETSETALAIARINYFGGSDAYEEQFPILVRDGRHALLNKSPQLYALVLDPQRVVQSVELLDRSPHVQLILFGAGIADDFVPDVQPKNLPPRITVMQVPLGQLNIEDSPWFRTQSPNGEAVPTDRLRAKLNVESEKDRRTATLVLENKGNTPLEFELVFPSLVMSHSSESRELYYLFPRQGAVISSLDTTLENFYGGAFPLQFLDIFSPLTNSGACVLIMDTLGIAKTFWLRKRGNKVQVQVRYPVRLAPGETYKPPQAVVRFHSGDWREGFDIYRSWLGTWYKPAGPRPAWLRNAFWCRRDYPVYI